MEPYEKIKPRIDAYRARLKEKGLKGCIYWLSDEENQALRNLVKIIRKENGMKRFTEWMEGKADMLPDGMNPMSMSLDEIESTMQDQDLPTASRAFLAGVLHARTYEAASRG